MIEKFLKTNKFSKEQQCFLEEVYQRAYSENKKKKSAEKRAQMATMLEAYKIYSMDDTSNVDNNDVESDTVIVENHKNYGSDVEFSGTLNEALENEYVLELIKKNNTYKEISEDKYITVRKRNEQ